MPSDNKLIRKKLANIVAANAPVTKKQADIAVIALFDAMTDQLANGGSIEIRGFGSLSVRRAKAMVSNISGPVPKRYKAVFRQARLLKQRLNPEKKEVA